MNETSQYGETFLDHPTVASLWLKLGSVRLFGYAPPSSPPSSAPIPASGTTTRRTTRFEIQDW